MNYSMTGQSPVWASHTSVTHPCSVPLCPRDTAVFERLLYSVSVSGMGCVAVPALQPNSNLCFSNTAPTRCSSIFLL
jgi:hypothetical protein